MPERDRASYMAEYRAAKKARKDAELAVEKASAERAKRTPRPVTDEPSDPPRRYVSDGERLGDGLPDTGVLIQGLTQKQRDAILAKLPTTKRGVN